MSDPTKRSDIDPKAPRDATGGESQGGAYPNPHTGQKPTEGGFMGHGGQSDMTYRGTGGEDDPSTENQNAPAESGAGEDRS